MLVYIGVIVAASLIVTEILLIVAIRAAVKEIRAIRQEMPRMLGLSVGVSLLLGAAQLARGVAHPPRE